MASLDVPSLFEKRQTNWGSFLLVSLFGHAAIALVAVVWSWVMPSEPRLDLNQRPISASLVRLGQERDEKLLPRIEEAPPPPPPEPVPAPKPVETPAPVAEAEPVLVPTEEPAPKVEKKKTETVKTDAARRSKLSNAFSKVGQKPTTHSGASDGDPLGDSEKQEGERYYGMLVSQVKQHYDVSASISEQERIRLKAIVMIQIGHKGQLLSAKLEKSSGNRIFDSAVVAAVTKSAPFVPPPEHLRAQLKEGLPIEFSP